jgi:hypothetical protein
MAVTISNSSTLGTDQDAVQLRRIAMTLHRWRELECGNSNNYASWAIVRGAVVNNELKVVL